MQKERSIQDKRLGRVHNNRPDIIRMRLKTCNLLRGIIIINPQLEIIATTDDPVLPRHETTSPDWDICQLERLDYSLIPSIRISFLFLSLLSSFVWKGESITCVS